MKNPAIIIIAIVVIAALGYGGYYFLVKRKKAVYELESIDFNAKTITFKFNGQRLILVQNQGIGLNGYNFQVNEWNSNRPIIGVTKDGRGTSFDATSHTFNIPF